jgi:hypothetical protein
MTGRGEVGWGDAVTAAAELGLTDPADLGRLVEVLGLAAPAMVPPAVPPRPPGTDRDVPAAGWAVSPAGHDDLPASRDRRTEASELSADPVDLAGLTRAEPVPPSAPAPDPVPYQSPVPAHQLRAALAMLVRRTRLGSRPDVAAAVQRLAVQQPLTDLPRAVETSTSAGAVVLADVGAGMLPYLADVSRLVIELGQAVGWPRVDVIWLADADPLPGLPTDRPVLLLSSLGAAAPAGARPARRRWDGLREPAASGDVVALVPHRRLRGTGPVRVVAWDDLPGVGRGRG